MVTKIIFPAQSLDTAQKPHYRGSKNPHLVQPPYIRNLGCLEARA